MADGSHFGFGARTELAQRTFAHHVTELLELTRLLSLRETDLHLVLGSVFSPECAKRVGSSTERVMFSVRECAEGGCGDGKGVGV